MINTISEYFKFYYPKIEGLLFGANDIAPPINQALQNLPSVEPNNLPLSLEPREVVIIGSGPASYTAAIYAARANLHPLVYEGSISENSLPGGQLMTTTRVENFPGFPDGIDGPTLVENMRTQAINSGAAMLQETVVEADLGQYPFVIQGEKTHQKALAVIVATGASANRIKIPGAQELWQKGVSACAVCDGSLPLFRNHHLFVIGGGDSAMEEALYLAKFASKVSIVHRRDRLRASQAMQKAVFANPKIEIIWDSVMSRINGKNTVESVVIENSKTKKETTYEAAGVFFAVGHTPNTAFLHGQLALDANGVIQTKPGSTETSIPYVYAAGDVQDNVYRQAITAASSGCQAALQAARALELSQQNKVAS